jgi:hypothetical protein
VAWGSLGARLYSLISPLNCDLIPPWVLVRHPLHKIANNLDDRGRP